MHNFVVHSNESACRKSGALGLDQVQRGGNINVNLVAKPKLAHTLGFTMFPEVYYLTICADVLTRKATSESGVQHTEARYHPHYIIEPLAAENYYIIKYLRYKFTYFINS